ncbi:MAG: hypothetical protein ACI9OJ_002734 [Myxococcota bacterium]|jgi:hypothetical protein
MQRLLAGPTAAPAASTGLSGSAADDVSKSLQLDVTKLRKELAALGKIVPSRAKRVGTPSQAFAISSSPVFLNTESSTSVLRSTEEINTEPTAYGPLEPVWEESSTASIDVGGDYTGTGDETLTFTVVQSAAVDAPAVIEVRRDNYALIDTIQVEDRDTAYEIFGGLELTFGDGEIAMGDSFQVTANITSGGAANPSGNFDESGESGANLDEGHTITNGSFRVNGQLVSVEKDDSIDTVLERFNALDFGFTGAYDAEADELRFDQDDLNSGASLVFSNDTSGFLAAAKLVDAEAVHNTVDERAVPMDQVAALGAISNGSFSIGGIEFNIDTSSDSLNDVIARINESEAGVAASYDAVSGKLSINNESDSSMSVVDGTSGFLGAMAIDAGAYENTNPEVRSGLRSRAITDAMVDIDKLITSIFRKVDQFDGGITASYKTNLLEALDDMVEGGGSVQRTKFGFTLRTTASNGNAIELDESKFRSALKRRPKDVLKFLNGDGTDDNLGLIAGLDLALKGIEASLERQNGRSGLLINSVI